MRLGGSPSAPGGLLGGALRRWGRWGGSAETLPRPHQHRAVLVHRELFDLNQLHLEVCQILVIEGELALEGAIGGPALPLEELDDAGEHGIEVHHRSSACASTASTCGSQKVIAMAW